MSSSSGGLIFNLSSFLFQNFLSAAPSSTQPCSTFWKTNQHRWRKISFLSQKSVKKKIKSVSLRLFTGDKVVDVVIVDVVIVDVVIGHRCRRHLRRRRHWRTFYLKFWSGLFFSREEKMIVVLKKQRRERDWCWKTRVSVICQRSCSRPPPFFHPRKKFKC